jgi:hypothetical protein
MSAVLAFTAPAQRPIEPDYIDEPCSEVGDVRGSRHYDNVTYVNFLPATAAPTPRLRITQRGRRVLTALVALPLVIAAFSLALSSGGATATSTATSNDFSYVTIASGQSLWQLAQQVAPNRDPRDVVDAIVALNHLQGEIQPGQRIALPRF